MNLLKKIISYPLSLLFYLFFGISLLFFHGIQVFCRHVLGKRAHQKSVDLLNFCLLTCLYTLGSRAVYKNSYNIPTDKPLIIVSNHQSMYDICMMVWFMRKHAPKFISKIELGKGIPSISYNLRHGGSVLIDRKNPRQSLPALANFGKRIAKDIDTAVIFPEGTRSKTGIPKSFAPNGLKTLFKYIPDAVVVPVTVNNSWKLVQNGMFPLGVGVKLSLEVQEPIAVNAMETEVLLKTIEERVVAGIKN